MVLLDIKDSLGSLREIVEKALGRDALKIPLSTRNSMTM